MNLWRPIRLPPRPANLARSVPFLLCQLVFAFLGVGTAASQDVQSLIPGSPEARAFLRAQDDILHVYIKARLLTSMSSVESSKPSRKVRRRVRGWNNFIGKRTDEILAQSDPLVALLDLWAFTQRIDDYVHFGEGRDEFDEVQAIVQKTTRDILDAATATAEAHLDPAAFKVAKENVRIFARDHPVEYKRGFLAGLFSVTDVAFSVVDIGQDTLGTVASLPLMPFRAGEGIRDFNVSARDFNVTAAEFAETASELSVTASRFTDIVEALPERTREEIQTLLHGIDDRSSTLTMIATDLRVISENFDAGLQTAERLAPDVRATVADIDSATDSAGRAAESIHLAAVEIRHIVDGLDVLLDRFEARTPRSGSTGAADQQAFDPDEYAQAARAIESGSADVRLLLEQIDKLVNPTEKREYPEGYRRFDIRDYTEAARAIESGSVQVRGILNDTATVAENDALFERAADATDRISARIESLVQFLLIRLGLFLLFLFALVLVYRFLRARLAPEPES
jgi:hypothetical protein